MTLADDIQRTLLLNLCAAEGHEVVDRKWVDVSQGDLQKMTLDMLIVDLTDALPVLQILRNSELFRSVAVLVVGPETSRSALFKSITAGANGSVTLPIKRDALLEKVHGTLSAFGRQVKLKPTLLKERRSQPREGGHLLCILEDKFLRSAQPVREATLLNVSDAGLRIEYRRPTWPSPHAYMAHAVHPQHFFFNYAKANPLGRALSVTFPSAAGRTLEGHAKFVHLSYYGDFEVAGLVLEQMKSSVREHMTAIRGGRVAPKLPETQPSKPPPPPRRGF